MIFNHLNYQIKANYSPMPDAVELWIYRQAAGHITFVENAQMTEITLDPEAPQPFEPTIRLRMDLAIRLMDALWSAGVRPSDGVDHPAHIEALHNHIKDLQRMAFDG